MWCSGDNFCTYIAQPILIAQEEKTIPWMVLPKLYNWDFSTWLYTPIMPYSYKILYENEEYAEDVNLVHGMPIIVTIRKKNINGKISIYIKNNSSNKVSYYISFLAKKM